MAMITKNKQKIIIIIAHLQISATFQFHDPVLANRLWINQQQDALRTSHKNAILFRILVCWKTLNVPLEYLQKISIFNQLNVTAV